MSSGTRRTHSVPQGDPCAADLFGAAIDVLGCSFLRYLPIQEVECSSGRRLSRFGVISG